MSGENLENNSQKKKENTNKGINNQKEQGW